VVKRLRPAMHHQIPREGGEAKPKLPQLAADYQAAIASFIAEKLSACLTAISMD